MSNIADGFGRGSHKEFLQFLFIARGSLSEQAQLYVSKDQHYISEHEFKKAYDMTNEITRPINSFIKSISNLAKKGLKNA